MINRLWGRFARLSDWLKVIFILCLLGALLNLFLVGKDLYIGRMLWRLHIGFFILYFGQVIFLWWGERTVFILSLLQALVALLTNLDFTFVPVMRVIGGIFYIFHGTMSLEQLSVYKYVFVSACFTLELLKTYLLWALLEPEETTSSQTATTTQSPE